MFRHHLGQLEVIRLLIARGADVNQDTPMGPALFSAASNSKVRALDRILLPSLSVPALTD